jgi:hypothetical protein
LIFDLGRRDGSHKCAVTVQGPQFHAGGWQGAGSETRCEDGGSYDGWMLRCHGNLHEAKAFAVARRSHDTALASPGPERLVDYFGCNDVPG